MSRETWSGEAGRERLGELFERALALEPDERAAFLEAACDDRGLRAELISLLASHATAPAFLERLAAHLLPDVLETLSVGVASGQRVAGRYEIVERLGGGGMGDVYKALDRALDRPVALKFLPPFLSGDPAARARLQREAKAASALDHPNIAVVYDIGATEPGSDDGEGAGLFIAMAHYTGETLAERIGRGPLAVHRALDFALQIADALAHAHRAGIVHRDVKPSNVLVTDEGQIKLLDFGVARVSGVDVTSEPSAPGTLAYMSPEQIRGDASDTRTDIWSLGVVLYEMIAGARPFRGAADRKLLHAIRHDEPPPLVTLRSDVPAGLASVVERCLAKDPSKRYATAEALRGALRAVDDTTAGLSHAPAPRPASGEARRTRLLPPLLRSRAALASWGGVVLAIALGTGSLARARSPALHADWVVVAPLENRTGDPGHDAFGGIAAEWITSSLQRAGMAGVIPADVAHASADYARTAAESRAGDPTRALAEATGAGLVVTGASYPHTDSLRVQITVTDVLERRTLPLDPVTVPVDELAAAMEPLGQRTLAALSQVLEPLVPPDMRFRQRPSLNLEAHLARVAGWEAEARFDRDEALVHYERAVELDPEDLGTSLRIASLRIATTAEFDLRMGADVDSVLALLDRSRGELIPADQAWLDFLIATRGRDRVRVYEAAKRWAALSPGATLASWNWGLEAIRFNRPQEAIRLLTDMDPARYAQGHFTATDYWTTLMDALHLVGDHREEVAAARRAIRLQPDDPFVLAWAGVAFAAGGQVTEAWAAVDARLASPPDAPTQTSMTLALVARELEAHGRRDEGRAMFERLVAWYAGLPASEKAAFDPLMWHGIALDHLGRLDEAEASFRAAGAMAPVDSVPGLAIWANGWLGDVAAQRGNLHEVERIDEWLAADRRPWGWGSFFRACIAARLERREDAVALLRRAFSEGMYRNPPAPRWHRYPCFDALREYEPFQELVRPRG